MSISVASNSQSVVLGTIGGVLAFGAIAVTGIVSVVFTVVVHMRRKQKSIPVEKGSLVGFLLGKKNFFGGRELPTPPPPPPPPPPWSG